MSRRLKDGAVESGHIDLLAREVAEFHEGAAAAAAASRWATPPEVQRQAVENLDALETVSDAGLRSELAHLRKWTAGEWERLQASFDERRSRGRIRECHGDLHLGNMVWLDGRVVLFDGIEFNESLRWIDVVSDAAFVAMDLMDRGRTDYARRFINAYFERTGDYAGLAVLPFYMVYRALVRAKVAGIRLQQTGEDDRRTPGERELAAYVHLAAECTRRLDPSLAITCGVSGSGKTRGTQPLVERDGMMRVRSDVERKRLHGLSAEESAAARPGDGIYTSAASRRTYDRLAEIARQVIEAGYPVVIDATFLRRAHRDRFRRLADDLGVPFRIVPFEADEAELRRRLRGRPGAGDASDADEAVLEYQLRHREPLGEDERPYVVLTA